MKIGILGTGMVGAALGGKFTQLGHQVKMGSRTANNEAAAKWVRASGPNASQGTFSDAASFGELVFICLNGAVFLEVAKGLDAKVLDGKVLVDVSNPLDFSSGSLNLSICNTNSLGEEVQKALPAAKVVKSFNTVNCEVVNPEKGGNPTMFVCGNDAGAKERFTDLIKTLGWRDILDIGDITRSRGTEALMHLWMNLYQVFGTPHFGWKIVRTSEA
jgi:predicted dinucleotide-binding enzyme